MSKLVTLENLQEFNEKNKEQIKEIANNSYEAGDNITITENEETGNKVISATSGGSADLSDYYTKEEIDPIDMYSITQIQYNNNPSGTFDKFINFLNGYAKGKTKILYLRYYSNSNPVLYIFSGLQKTDLEGTGSSQLLLEFNRLAVPSSYSVNYGVSYTTGETRGSITIYVNTSDYANGIMTDIYSDTRMTSSYRNGNMSLTLKSLYSLNYNYQILGMSNNQAYTPTANYHPATKKYVDDAIAGIDGGGSGGSIEPTKALSQYLSFTTNDKTYTNFTFDTSATKLYLLYMTASFSSSNAGIIGTVLVIGNMFVTDNTYVPITTIDAGKKHVYGIRRNSSNQLVYRLLSADDDVTSSDKVLNIYALN